MRTACLPPIAMVPLLVLTGSAWASAATVEASASATAAEPVVQPADEPPPVVSPDPSPEPQGEPAAEPTMEPSDQPEAVDDPLVTTREEEDVQRAHPVRYPTPFDRGRVRVAGSLGWAQGSTTDWLVLGAGAGYYLLDGLEVHGDATFWLVGSPFVMTLTPGVRYVFHMLPQIKPYVGAFYRHYFVDAAGYDSDSVGGRAGIYFVVNRNVYVGGGLVVEQFFNNHFFSSDTQVYPELTVGFAF